MSTYPEEVELYMPSHREAAGSILESVSNKTYAGSLCIVSR